MAAPGEQRATLIDRHSSMEDCWRVVTTAERTGTVFMLMEQVRFSGYIRAWRRIVDAGRFIDLDVRGLMPWFDAMLSRGDLRRFVVSWA